MNDLISRRDAIDAIEGITASMSVCINADEHHGMTRMRRQAVLEVANLPSAEPERKTGKWIEHHRTDLGEKLNHCIECSECKIWFSIDELLRRSFCPNCGADMRGGDAE